AGTGPCEHCSGAARGPKRRADRAGARRCCHARRPRGLASRENRKLAAKAPRPPRKTSKNENHEADRFRVKATPNRLRAVPLFVIILLNFLAFLASWWLFENE